ncbi:redoxin domain-containing protein [Sphingobacterium sp. CZ-2]|uniref:redoxin domain-containing protein n=1 Tax=Sphingobacterium sp. CZ-2 TaxID=2557994 RepID=UPI001070183F|nr:redoxin domain-containing protein [Sphingobacterium sp. CZ-2]QBR11583.1 redoxin domain-containing protein [Sphingobacterium sp. CZ-2]
MTLLHAVAMLWHKLKQIFQPANKGYVALGVSGRHFFTVLCFMLFSGSSIQAQSREVGTANNIAALNIGDPVPDALWDLPLQVVNHPEGRESITLSEYKGKLIILDFWATWCPSCITSLQKLDTIQKELTKEVVIIPVTNDKLEKAETFIKAQRWQLPTVVNNSILQEYFPHKYIPHYVWVNPEGRIEAITGIEPVNRANIKAVINGENLNVPNKVDLLSFDSKKPLFIDGNGGNGTAIKYRSLFSEAIPGVFQMTSSVISDSINKTSRIYGINCRALTLYSLAYKKIQSFSKERIKYEIIDSVKRALFVSSEDPSRPSTSDLFTYELITPLSEADKVRGRVAVDLQHFFGLNARFEKRKTDCYVLKALPNLHKSSSKGGERKDNFFDEDSGQIYTQNNTMDALYGYLNEVLPLLVVDETNYSKTLDLQFPRPDQKDLTPLQEALRKQGISLEKAKREIEFFIISDH